MKEVDSGVDAMIERMRSSIGRARPKLAHAKCDEAQRLQGGREQHGSRRSGRVGRKVKKIASKKN